MTTARVCVLLGSALFVGALAVGCGSAQTEAPATSDSGSASSPQSRSPKQPTPSDPVDHAESEGRPMLVQDDQDPVAADLQRLARSFVRYAVSDSDALPHRESVSMSLGGEPVVAIDDFAAAMSTRRIWKICPADWDLYGASSCPVDLLAPITDADANDAPLIYSAAYGDVICAPTRTGPLPEGRLVVIRPIQQWRSCASDFALVLAADDQGRLRAIDLTLSEP